MACCDLLDTCQFYKRGMADMPCTYKHLTSKYCKGDHTHCARFVYAKANGTNNVPPEMFPNDESNTLDFDVRESGGGVAMLIKVIYADGSSGMLRTSRLSKLISKNRIAAYEVFDRWIEVRRKQSHSGYPGPERRKQGFA
jgi:hypothetical protein